MPFQLLGYNPRLLVEMSWNGTELYDRLYPFQGNAAHDIHISTIHSFCQTLLDRYPAAHPWGPAFEVLDAQGQFLFVYARLSDLDLSKFLKGRVGEFPPTSSRRSTSARRSESIPQRSSPR